MFSADLPLFLAAPLSEDLSLPSISTPQPLVLRSPLVPQPCTRAQTAPTGVRAERALPRAAVVELDCPRNDGSCFF